MGVFLALFELKRKWVSKATVSTRYEIERKESSVPSGNRKGQQVSTHDGIFVDPSETEVHLF